MENQPIVIDCGSGLWKGGFAGEKEPSTVFPMIIGTLKYLQEPRPGLKEYYIGDEAINSKEFLLFRYPIEHRNIKDPYIFNKALDYMFYNKLYSDPQDNSVLLTGIPEISKPKRDDLVEYMFETMGVMSLKLYDQGLLSIISTGRKSAINLNIGDGISEVKAVFDEKENKSASQINDIGGRDLTDYLRKLINENDKTKRTISESYRESVRDLKENFCYVSLDYENELNKKYIGDVHYDISKGYIDVTINKERFVCPELLFKPFLNGFGCVGVDRLIFDSINKCENEDVRKVLFNNIVLTGGCSLFNGFSERIKKEIACLAKPSTNIDVIVPPNSKYAAWIGGSILASSEHFKKIAVTSDQYYESGKNIDI